MPAILSGPIWLDCSTLLDIYTSQTLWLIMLMKQFLVINIWFNIWCGMFYVSWCWVVCFSKVPDPLSANVMRKQKPFLKPIIRYQFFIRILEFSNQYRSMWKWELIWISLEHKLIRLRREYIFTLNTLCPDCFDHYGTLVLEHPLLQIRYYILSQTNVI